MRSCVPALEQHLAPASSLHDPKQEHPSLLLWNGALIMESKMPLCFLVTKVSLCDLLSSGVGLTVLFNSSIMRVTAPLLQGCLLPELYRHPMESTRGLDLCLQSLAGLIKSNYIKLQDPLLHLITLGRCKCKKIQLYSSWWHIYSLDCYVIAVNQTLMRAKRNEKQLWPGSCSSSYLHTVILCTAVITSKEYETIVCVATFSPPKSKQTRERTK